MPRLRSLRSAALLVFLAACGNDSTGSQPEGRMSGTLDGAPWRGVAHATLNGNTLSVGSTREGVEQHVIATITYSGPGLYVVEPGMGRYIETTGGDVLAYEAKGTSGTLEIDSYNRTLGIMKGSLKITGEGTRGVTRFDNGEFVTRVMVVTP